MGKIEISEDRTYLIKDGKPFFYLADTAWMAFEKLSLSEWEEYIYKRRSQGFNVIQISMLPISHDNSVSQGNLQPFGAGKENGVDFFCYKEEYFLKAEKMLAIMQEADMVPCLHLLWANYVPDTWAAKLSPDTVMPFEAVAPFIKFVANRYKQFSPIYSISGDTSFETERVVAYYKEALKILKEADSACLATLHLQPQAEWPHCLIEEERLDFYTYQGGHFKEQQENNIRSAEWFSGQEKIRPVINSELPYEGHGWGFRYGRFDAFDVRMALWKSILSGAKAGIGYGAHGTWMFHTREAKFNNRTFSDMPYCWRNALEFEGAWDVGYAKWLYETYCFHRLRPARLVENHSDMIKSAMSREEDLIAVYVPYNTEVIIKKDMRGYRATAVDLDKKHIITPEISYRDRGESVVRRMEACKDVLLIFLRL